jgi:hypothetical protein
MILIPCSCYTFRYNWVVGHIVSCISTPLCGIPTSKHPVQRGSKTVELPHQGGWDVCFQSASDASFLFLLSSQSVNKQPHIYSHNRHILLAPPKTKNTSIGMTRHSRWARNYCTRQRQLKSKTKVKGKVQVNWYIFLVFFWLIFESKIGLVTGVMTPSGWFFLKSAVGQSEVRTTCQADYFSGPDVGWGWGYGYHHHWGTELAANRLMYDQGIQDQGQGQRAQNVQSYMRGLPKLASTSFPRRHVFAVFIVFSEKCTLLLHHQRHLVLLLHPNVFWSCILVS